MVRSSVLGIISAGLLFLNLSCSPVVYKTATPSIRNNKYDSEFPNANASKQLEDISNTVFRINSLAFYKVYIFSDSSRIKLDDLTEFAILTKNIKSTFMDRTSSGTGTVIYFSDGKVMLLTCAHIVSFPDTIITYFSDEKGVFTDHIQSVAIKDKETIYIAGFPERSEVDVLSIDKDADLALLGKDYGPGSNKNIPVFNYPFGFAKELEWGDFVYLFGFPMNYKMVSKAIVSNPNFDKSGSFFIDAVVNRGFSGGVVLALRDGVPNFELVGIVQWITDENQNVLEPAPLEGSFKYNPLVPYKGDSYAKQLQLLRYGITKVISAETIKDFLSESEGNLKKKGFFLTFKGQ